MALGALPLAKSSRSWSKTSCGQGRMYLGFHPLHTIRYQIVSPIPIAASLGQDAPQIRRPIERRVEVGKLSASRPAISASSASSDSSPDSSWARSARLAARSVTGVPPDLLMELGRDLGGQ